VALERYVSFEKMKENLYNLGLEIGDRMEKSRIFISIRLLIGDCLLHVKAKRRDV
jgi:hypothetical protein